MSSKDLIRGRGLVHLSQNQFVTDFKCISRFQIKRPKYRPKTERCSPTLKAIYFVGSRYRMPYTCCIPLYRPTQKLPTRSMFKAGTGSFICPVTQTWLDMPRPLITQSHRHGWTYQGLWLPSHAWDGGESKYSGTRQNRTADLSVHSRTRQPPDHDDHPKSQDRLYPGSSTGGGDLLPSGGGVVCENSPATCRPSPGGGGATPHWPARKPVSRYRSRSL